MTDKKGKIKKVIAEVREWLEYTVVFKCPYCKSYSTEEDIERDNITLNRTCHSCKKKYKVKIPKDSL